MTEGWYLKEVNANAIGDGGAKNAIQTAVASGKAFTMKFEVLKATS